MSAELKTDFTSRVWRDVAEFARARIAELREHNDTPGLPEAQTEGVRGEIKALKALIASAEPPRAVARRDIYFPKD